MAVVGGVGTKRALRAQIKREQERGTKWMMDACVLRDDLAAVTSDAKIKGVGIANRDNTIAGLRVDLNQANTKLADAEATAQMRLDALVLRDNHADRLNRQLAHQRSANKRLRETVDFQTTELEQLREKLGRSITFELNPWIPKGHMYIINRDYIVHDYFPLVSDKPRVAKLTDLTGA